MPGGRPRLPLDEHKDFIIDSIDVIGLTQEEVCQELAQSHGLKVGRSTLVKALGRWGVRTRKPNFEDSPALRMRLHHFFHQPQNTDADISETLTSKHGMPVTASRVAKLRKEMGLYKRVDADQKGVAEAAIEDLLKVELQDEGMRNLGQKELYKYLRAKYNVTGRARIFAIAKKLDPEGPARRSMAQRKGARRSGLRKECKRREEGFAVENSQQGLSEHDGHSASSCIPLDPAMYNDGSSTNVHLNSIPGAGISTYASYPFT